MWNPWHFESTKNTIKVIFLEITHFAFSIQIELLITRANQLTTTSCRGVITQSRGVARRPQTGHAHVTLPLAATLPLCHSLSRCHAATRCHSLPRCHSATRSHAATLPRFHAATLGRRTATVWPLWPEKLVLLYILVSSVNEKKLQVDPCSEVAFCINKYVSPRRLRGNDKEVCSITVHGYKIYVINWFQTELENKFDANTLFVFYSLKVG